MKNQTQLKKNEEVDRVKKVEILEGCLTYNYLAKKYPKDKSVRKLLNLDESNDNIKEKTEQIHALTDIKSFAKKQYKTEFIKVDKVVVIVGAGLSSEGKFPMGWATAEDLIKELADKKKIVRREYIEHRIEEIRLKNDQKEADFETVIEALSESKITEKEVKERLTQLFGLRNNPIMGYEILAHWLKHQVIDGIINFNFDELLDEAIEEEFVYDEYIKVIGGADYAENQLGKQKREFDRPLYLKPHGTISDPDSLRATRDHYLRTTSGFQSVLKRFLQGNVLFLCVGYNMASIELNRLLQAQIDCGALTPNFLVLKNSKLNIEGFPLIDNCSYQIDPSQSTGYGSPFLENLNQKLTENLFSKEYNKTKKEEGVSNEKDTYENVLKEAQNGKFPLKDVVRHKITNALFFDLDHTADEREEEYKIHVYNYLRALISFAIAVAKSGTIVNIFALNNSRFGYHYKKYYRSSKIKYTLVDICQKLDLWRPNYTPELWTVLNVTKDIVLQKEDNKKELKSIYLEDEQLTKDFWQDNFGDIFKQAIAEISKKIKTHIDVDIRKIVSSEDNSKHREKQLKLLDRFLERFRNVSFSDHLVKYSQGNNYEIAHPFSNGIPLVYKKGTYTKLYSWEQIQFEFVNLYNQIILDAEENKDATYEILYVATHGRYLNQSWLKSCFDKTVNDEKLKKKIKVKILLHNLPESYYYVSKFEQEDKYKDIVTINYMSWWTNNRNFAIFLKKDKDKNIIGQNTSEFIPISAIYYYRGSTTRMVSPISISVCDDNQKWNKLNEQKETLKNKESSQTDVMLSLEDQDELGKICEKLEHINSKMKHLMFYYDIFKVYYLKSKSHTGENDKKPINFMRFLRSESDDEDPVREEIHKEYKNANQKNVPKNKKN